MDFRSILCPTDFSEASAHAGRFASRLAGRFGSELIAVHVVPEISGDAPIADFLTRTGFQATRHRVLQGDPAAEIVRAAHQDHVDLIVMPTHGHGTLRRFILGSVTAKVLHDAACPVLTTTHRSDRPELGEKPFRAILCAVDLGPASASVLRAGASLARREDASLALLHMLPPQTLLGFSYYDPERWRLHAGAMLEKLLGDTGLDVPWYVREGELAPGVNSLASEIGASLLVIRRHPDGLPGRLRDQAYALVRESSIPVLSI